MVKLGVDAEFFVKGDETEEIIPADKFLPSVKEPKTMNDEGTILAHFDGLQGEFSVAPSQYRGFLVGRMREALKSIYDQLLRPEGCQYLMNSAVPTPREILDQAKPEAIIFGCDADYISWLDGMTNAIQLDENNHFVRYAGTHIHLGFSDKKGEEYLLNPVNQIELVNLMDILVAIPLVMLDPSDDAKERRKVYGKAGTYRDKPYGVEYRVLGSSILRHPALVYLALRLARGTYTLATVENYKELKDNLLQNIDVESVIVGINENDPKIARDVWDSLPDSVKYIAAESEELVRKINRMADKGGFFQEFPYNNELFMHYWNLRSDAADQEGKTLARFIHL